MNDTWRELRTLLTTRSGLGALLVTVSASIALGVVPTLLQSWTTHVWLLYVAFVVAVAGVLTGWALTRNRGLGIVLTLYHTTPSDSRARTMLRAARDRHSATLHLDRDELWPKDDALTMTDAQLHLVARLIDARCAELVDSGGSLDDVVLYPLMSLRDGYRLGQALRSTGAGPAIAHRSLATGDIIIGIKLHGRLREPLGHAPDFLKPPAESLLDQNPAVSPGQPGHQRLALIVRLAGRSQMVRRARHVAETGDPYDLAGNPTGYFFDPADRTAPGLPCGATVTVEATAESIPESPTAFAAAVQHVRHRWQTAHAAWSTQCNSRVDGPLFYNGPLPVAIALGWAIDDHTPAFVAHDPQRA